MSARRRWSGVTVAGIVLGAIGAVLAAVSKAGEAWHWPTPMLILLAFVAPLIGTIGSGSLFELLKNRQASAEENRTLRLRQQEALKKLLILPPSALGTLPTADEVDLYSNAVGVSPSRYAGDADPYVPRTEVDKQIDSSLAENRFVLVAGPSKAGKSRTAFEALLRMRPSPGLIIPRPGTLLELFGPSYSFLFQRGPIVLWLDDLERYIESSGGLDAALLTRMISGTPATAVVATITSDRRYRLRSTSGEIGRAAREVLMLAERMGCEVELRVDLTKDEYENARRFYPSETFTRGIGEQLVVAWEHEQLYKDGEEVDAVGWSIIRSAIDWRLARVGRPITTAELSELSRIYLPREGSDAFPTAQRYAEGFAWAQDEPKNSPAKALQQIQATPTPAYQAFDYLVAYAESKEQFPSEAAWKFIIEHASTEDLGAIHLAAYTAGAYDAAKRVLLVQIDSQDPVLAPNAAINLGSLLEEQGDLSAARAAYNRAINLGNSDQANTARNVLGAFLQKQGDLEGARTVWNQVLQSAQNGPAAAKATYNIGLLLRDQGDLQGAEAAWRRVLKFGHAEISAIATYNLGVLLSEQGDDNGAQAAWEQTVHLGLPQTAARAAVNLGALYLRQNDADRAHEAWQQALQSGSDEVASTAAYNLALLYLKRGFHDAARKAFKKAIDQGISLNSPAAYNLGILYHQLGRPDKAEVALERAITSSDSVLASQAALRLGVLRMDKNRFAEARELFEKAAKYSQPRVLTAASLGRALCLLAEGRIMEARSSLDEIAGIEDDDRVIAAVLGLIPKGPVRNT